MFCRGVHRDFLRVIDRNRVCRLAGSRVFADAVTKQGIFMPTGYTAKLMEQGQEFPEFVMTCARAFGALITMRDDPIDAPIPEKFAPSDYSVKAKAEAEAEANRLAAMSNPEKIAHGKSLKDAAIKRMNEMLAKEIAENGRLTDMQAKVERWTPPTKDHQGLKDFMLQQIGTSMNRVEYWRDRLAELRGKSPMAFYSDAVAEAERSIAYHTKSQKEEEARANGRTEWVKQLRESIKTA